MQLANWHVELASGARPGDERPLASREGVEGGRSGGGEGGERTGCWGKGVGLVPTRVKDRGDGLADCLTA